MTHDISASDRQPTAGEPGPSYAAPEQPHAQSPAPTTHTNGSAPATSSPYAPPADPYAGALHPYGPPSAQQQAQIDVEAREDKAPPERVGRGAALALLAIPVGMVVAGVIWKLGYVASISSFVVAILASVLYVRGSGGRIKKGIPVIAGVILVGVVAMFFTVVAVDIWGQFSSLDPDLAAQYPTRWSLVAGNIFYPPLLASYAKDGALLALFGLLGGFGTIMRLVRTHRSR